MGEKLLAEAPGILAWTVRGCLEWQEKGLGIPAVIEKATLEYQSESDLLNEFAGDCCVLEPEMEVSSASLWEEYEKWVKVQGQSILQRRVFTARTKRLKGVKLAKLGKAGTRGWRGIGLKREQPMALTAESACRGIAS